MALFTGLALACLGAGHIGDYALSAHIPDNPAGSIHALLHGQIRAAAAVQPVMGLGSIIVRLPFAALASALHGGETLTYRLGVLPCVLAVGLFGIVIGCAGAARRRPAWVAPLACLVLIVNPVSSAAIWLGHPEELLGGALCAGAVLAAARDRPRLAGVLLGAAVGTKEWALLAIVPALVAARPQQRRALALCATTVAVPLVGLLPLIDPASFLRTGRELGGLRLVSFTSWWWPLAAGKVIQTHATGSLTTAEVHTLPLGLSRAAVSWLAPAASVPFGWLVWRRSLRIDRVHALGLLALLLLLRAALDPVSMLYYFAPFVIALLGWELLTDSGAPRITMLAILGLWWSIEANSLGAEQRAAVFVLISGVLALGIARPLLRSDRAPGARIAPIPVPAR